MPDIAACVNAPHLFVVGGNLNTAQEGKHLELLTTPQTFGDQLHTYTIVDAINDGNVLPFRIDYVDPHGQILIIILEFVGGGIKVGVKCRIVIPDCAVQKVTGGLVKSIGIKALFTQHIPRKVKT